ncbi:Endonuclease/exonuclease/phosphatase [Schizophyllum amplum]|uniref:Endonuclease/exonuclease/phosphatase n=1 Tax=Schizophyllum amplum TaxID=97359 RepID=A0A550CN12_9AGAR|nr:Endonuclease/exonuclease/phosphatase [Auriculariopsis ampla]
MSDRQLRIFSLNCWGLKFIAKDRDERIRAIAAALAASQHDVICLQEIWVFADFERVRDAAAGRLPHSKFFYSGALGAGLAILSHFPIVATAVHPYSLNGAPMDVGAGDWFVGKAAATATILHPILGLVQIFNTHLFAKGGEDGPEYNRAHRLVNAWEFAKLARQAAELGRHVIAAGDFNSIPTTLPMEVIRAHAGLLDAWAVTHPNPAAGAATPQEALARFGVTADSPLNTYSAAKPLDSHARAHWGKRLDYVLYRQPVRAGPHPRLRATQCRVALTEIVPGCAFSYSDHFGLEATLAIEDPTQEDALAAPAEPTEVSEVAVAAFLQALGACYSFARERARKELTGFVLCLVLVVALAIGSSWLPHSWINPIFIIFTVFVSWAGTTLLYEGFLYGQWECNALMNVIEELEIYKKGLDLQRRHSQSLSRSA